MATKAPKKLHKTDLVRALNGQGARLMHVDLVGTAEAATLLNVERARIGKWRKNGILLIGGERLDFPEPIRVVTTEAKQNLCNVCGVLYPPNDKKCPNGHSYKQATKVADYMKLAASPLWWGDDIRALTKKLAKNKPRN